MECCQNSNIKLINGVWTCINCGLMHGPQIICRWIEYKQSNVIPYKQFIVELIIFHVN